MGGKGMRLAAMAVASALVAGGCTSGQDSERDAAVPPTASPVTPSGDSSQSSQQEPVQPISTRWLQRRGVLTSAADQEPTVTMAEAIQFARLEFAAESRRAPAARLYRVTVTDLGRPDRTQSYGYDLLIDHRLAWVLTFPKRRVFGSHSAWSDQPATGVARSVVFIDATNGDFLMAESF